MESNHKLSHGKEVDPENLGYEYFSLQVNNQTPINVSRHQLIKILNGTNTSISLSGNDITFNNTAVATPGASYTHPDKAWVDKTNLAGASVISNLTIDAKGHPTNWTVRALTPADIGAAPSTHTHDFDKYTKWRLQVGTDINDITTDELVRFVSSISNDIVLNANGHIEVRRKNKVVENATGASVTKLTDYNNKWMNITTADATFTVSGTFVKDDEIEGSFTGTGRLTIVGSGITLTYPTEYHQNKIPAGGTFALKFLSPTQAMLFGRLIPIGI